jgi:hypothetical protein
MQNLIMEKRVGVVKQEATMVTLLETRYAVSLFGTSC